MGVEKVVEVPVEQVRVETITNHVDNIIENPVYNTIEHPVERKVDKPVYVDNIIERPVHRENVIRQEVEQIIERPVYQDKIVTHEVVVETTVEKKYDNPIEQIVEVKVPNIIEVPIDVVIDRPVHVDKIVEHEVIKERVVEKPTQRVTNIDEELDVELKHNFDHAEYELKILTDSNNELRGKQSHLQAELANCRGSQNWLE